MEYQKKLEKQIEELREKLASTEESRDILQSQHDYLCDCLLARLSGIIERGFGFDPRGEDLGHYLRRESEFIQTTLERVKEIKCYESRIPKED